MSKIQLPTVLKEDTHFYEKHKEILKPYLGKPYISYSSSESWNEYREDFIKQKFVNIELPDTVYTALGNYLGEAVENGKFGENPYGFTGQENFKLIPRPKKGVYERLVLIDFGTFIFIGFIDIFEEKKNKKVRIKDLKTGGSKKEVKYSSDDYTQVVLYAKALEEEGYTIDKISVWFVRREGSHIKPPLHISEEQFEIPLKYNEERVQFALDRLVNSVNEISDCYKTYLKYFN